MTFPGGESGISVPRTVCTPKSVGISVDTNTYEPHLLAGTMAHMIGHNIGKNKILFHYATVCQSLNVLSSNMVEEH